MTHPHPDAMIALVPEDCRDDAAALVRRAIRLAEDLSADPDIPDMASTDRKGVFRRIDTAARAETWSDVARAVNSLCAHMLDGRYYSPPDIGATVSPRDRDRAAMWAEMWGLRQCARQQALAAGDDRIRTNMSVSDSMYHGTFRERHARAWSPA